jgi:MFS-type transporter involved in bile tolerance (Atg22 family)
MSAFETILRSVIPLFVAKEKLAYVYGVFGLIQGTSWFAGSMILSYLYQTYGKITAFIYLPIPSIMISLGLLLAITKKEQA